MAVAHQASAAIIADLVGVPVEQKLPWTACARSARAPLHNTSVTPASARPSCRQSLTQSTTARFPLGSTVLTRAPFLEPRFRLSGDRILGFGPPDENPSNATLQWHFRRRVSTVLVGTMVEARWLEMMVSSDHPLADERVAEAIARVLSRYWVDPRQGVEVILTHRGANIAYLVRATG